MRQHTHSFTHSWGWALLEKLPLVQPLKNFTAFYGNRRFITVFTRALHWSLFWARSIQSIESHPISLSQTQSNIVHPPTSWSSQWSVSFCLSYQYLICFPLPPIRATCRAHLILLDLIILITLGEMYKLRTEMWQHRIKQNTKKNESFNPFYTQTWVTNDVCIFTNCICNMNTSSWRAAAGRATEHGEVMYVPTRNRNADCFEGRGATFCAIIY
jgi:hypothetical protein